MKDPEYKNPFEEVHRKAKAFRESAREVLKNHLELRESRSAREQKEIVDKEVGVRQEGS